MQLLSAVIPANNKEEYICPTRRELRLPNTPHQIVVVNDGSSDSTWQKLLDLREHDPDLEPVQNQELHGFGRAAGKELDCMGDALVVMMADESNDCRDVVRYRDLLNQG